MGAGLYSWGLVHSVCTEQSVHMWVRGEPEINGLTWQMSGLKVTQVQGINGVGLN